MSFLSFLKGPKLDLDEQILRLWNNPKLLFPAIPPADFAYARARLTAFQSATEWLTTFEIVGYNSGAAEVVNQVDAFGNRLRRKKQWFYEPVVASPAETDHYPELFDEEGKLIIGTPLDFDIEIRGKRHHLSPTHDDYARLAIDLSKVTAGEVDPLIKVLRLLTYTFPEGLFFSDAELLEKLGRPHDLPRFLQVYDWYHPDWRKREKPSDSPCLRSLARALAHNDPTLYKCPAELANTHWSNWPEWPN